MTPNTYTLSERLAADVLRQVAPHDYIVAVGAHTVIEHRSNGQSFFMTYRTELGARKGAQRASADVPGAEVVKRHE